MIDDRTDPHPRRKCRADPDLPTQAEVRAARSSDDRYIPGEYGHNIRIRKTSNSSKTSPPSPETDWQTCDECMAAVEPRELHKGRCKECRREARDKRR